jgi:hypothetical protein
MGLDVEPVIPTVIVDQGAFLLSFCAKEACLKVRTELANTKRCVLPDLELWHEPLPQIEIIPSAVLRYVSSYDMFTNTLGTILVEAARNETNVGDIIVNLQDKMGHLLTELGPQVTQQEVKCPLSRRTKPRMVGLPMPVVASFIVVACKNNIAFKD